MGKNEWYNEVPRMLKRDFKYLRKIARYRRKNELLAPPVT